MWFDGRERQKWWNWWNLAVLATKRGLETPDSCTWMLFGTSGMLFRCTEGLFCLSGMEFCCAEQLSRSCGMAFLQPETASRSRGMDFPASQGLLSAVVMDSGTSPGLFLWSGTEFWTAEGISWCIVTDLRCTGDISVGNGTKVFPAETSCLNKVMVPGLAGTLFRSKGTAFGITCKLTNLPGAEVGTSSVRRFPHWVGTTFRWM